MGKITSFFQSLKQKIKEMTLMRKIAIGVVSAIVLIAIVLVVISLTKTKYAILYTGLEAQDAKTVQDGLKDQGVKYEVKDGTIYVPEKQVDKLQIDYDTQINSGVKGLDIFDESNMLGMSEDEFNVKYQQGIQGEMVKALKSLPQIESATANLVPAKDSAFVKESNKASASIIIKTVDGVELEKSQIKALLSSISKMAKDLPMENITIMDQNMVDLTEGILDDQNKDGTASSNTADFDKQLKAKTQYENEMKKKLSGALTTMVGSGKFTVTTNADLDFDKKEINETAVEKDPPLVSEQNKESTQTDNGDAVTSSPTDDNLSNTLYDENGKLILSTNKENTKNYNTDGKTVTYTSQAEGKPTKLSVSVSIDNPNLTRAEASDYIQYIRNSFGLEDETAITLIGLEFNPQAKAAAEEQLKAMQDAENAKNLNKLYTILAISVGSLLLVLVLLVVMRSKRKAEEIVEDFEELDEGLDVIIADEDENYKTIDFNEKSEEAMVEEQIKKYAEEKPDQVADIVKSWLVGDEGGV